MADPGLRIGTRASALALWQARHVQGILRQHGVEAELVEITTTGDKILDVPLADIGDKALFTKELDVALIENRIDIAVHSLKDLPTTLPDGIVLCAVSDREDPTDAFVPHPSFSGTMADLPFGATLATSSLRRSAQLKAWRDDLRIVSVRGNVNTRLQKLDASDWEGMILASAGLIRLGMAERIGEPIDHSIMLPAVSQGVLGVVGRREDRGVFDAVRSCVHHLDTEKRIEAERAFLRRLEGGCSVPVGAHAVLRDGMLTVEGVVASLDGSSYFRGTAEGVPDDAGALGVSLAEELLARGAGDVLRRIKKKLPSS
ncbi:MAG: hydroxymethylbilane synthase [Bacteroidota bacterium]